LYYLYYILPVIKLYPLLYLVVNCLYLLVTLRYDGVAFIIDTRKNYEQLYKTLTITYRVKLYFI